MSKENENTTKKSNNHFTTTIRPQHEELYTKTKQLSEKLGCPVGMLVWYSLNLMFEEKKEPKTFGLG